MFVRDLQTDTTTLVSADAGGDGRGGGGHNVIEEMFRPQVSVSVDGRYVAFVSHFPLMPDTDDPNNIFVRDMQLGTMTRVTVATDGGGPDRFSGEPVISADGRYVAFKSEAHNLVANAPREEVSEIYVRDLVAGSTTLVSTNTTGGTREPGQREPVHQRRRSLRRVRVRRPRSCSRR